MRELTQTELGMVEGGNPAAVVVVPVVIGVVVLAGLALLAYAVHENCSGSLEISDEGLKVEVTCPGSSGGG
jgi:hypothetical protein